MIAFAATPGGGCTLKVSCAEARPASLTASAESGAVASSCRHAWETRARGTRSDKRSEEHTSELQSQSNIVCRLLLEKKNNNSDQRRYPNLNIYDKKPHLHCMLLYVLVTLSLTRRHRST